MTIRIFKLSDWALLQPTEDLHLLLDNAGRKVTIQFNTETDTRVGWVGEGSGKDVLLGTFKGREDIEFRPNGPGVVTVESEGEVWFYTDDGAQTVAGSGDEQESYRRLLEPRDRAEVLERIIAQQNATHNRLMAAQAGERAALLERIAAQEAALKEAASGENAGGLVAGAEPQANGGAGGDSNAGQAAQGAGVQPAK